MKDIDFDELDKAVNSLMATAPSDSPKGIDDVKPETTLDISSSAPALASAPVLPAAPTQATTVETVAVTTSAAPAPATPASPVAPAVKRTGGRFMDMVHTSSDMKPQSRQAAASPSREGLSVQPRPGTGAPLGSAAPANQAPSPAPAPALDAMPDPLELNAAPETPDSPEPAQAPEPTSPSPVVSDSPFIADAKVEKRPLNAEATATEPSFDTQMANELTSDEQGVSDDTEKTDASADEPPTTPQVPELSSDLVAIESNEKVAEPVATQTVDTKDAAKDVDEPSVPLGATSIAKQYKSHPSTGDQSHAAIYDASQYPEPVTHPAKKKSGWLWVLWVILLLGAGAGAAVLLYSMGIIP